MVDDREGKTRTVGPITVSISSDDLLAFDVATNFHAEAGHKWERANVPLSYLPTLLGHPSVKPKFMDTLLKFCGQLGVGLVHTKQEITVHHPLKPDFPYSLILNYRRITVDIIQVAVEISDSGAGPVALMQSELMVAQAEDTP